MQITKGFGTSEISRSTVLPELPRPDDIAVVAGAVLIILVIPGMFSSAFFAVPTLGQPPVERAWQDPT